MSLFKQHSVTGRVAIGLVLGFVFGALEIILLKIFGLHFNAHILLGTMILFALMGMVIGFIGMYNKHPVFGFTLHWWMRGIIVGGIFGFIFGLLTYNQIASVMQSTLMQHLGFHSPLWVICDTMFWGLIIAFVETRVAGEGKKLPLV